MKSEGKMDIFWKFLIPSNMYGRAWIKLRQTMKRKLEIFISKVSSAFCSTIQCIFLSHSLRDVFVKDIDKGGE